MRLNSWVFLHGFHLEVEFLGFPSWVSSGGFSLQVKILGFPSGVSSGGFSLQVKLLGVPLEDFVTSKMLEDNTQSSQISLD